MNWPKSTERAEYTERHCLTPYHSEAELRRRHASGVRIRTRSGARGWEVGATATRVAGASTLFSHLNLTTPSHTVASHTRINPSHRPRRHNTTTTVAVAAVPPANESTPATTPTQHAPVSLPPLPLPPSQLNAHHCHCAAPPPTARCLPLPPPPQLLRRPPRDPHHQPT